MSLTSTIDGEGNAFIRLGQNPVIEPLNVTENGTHEVPDGVDGFNPVTVALPEYEGAYTVEPSTETQTLATAGKVMTQDVVINKAHGSPLELYQSKKVEANVNYGTFDDFQRAMFPDLPMDRDLVMIEFENNTSNNRAGIGWVRAKVPKTNIFATYGQRVGNQFGGSFGCDVYAGATINVYVGDY